MSDSHLPNADGVVSPFVATTTPAIERANRLMSLRAHPGFLDLLRISQDLVDYAAAVSIDYPGWDAQQITVLKCRAQAAKEHHATLLDRVAGAIQQGVAEAAEQTQAAVSASLPAKTAEDAVDQGDFVRQAVLTRFADNDTRIPGSY